MFNQRKMLRGMAAFGLAACLAFPQMASAAEVEQTVTVTEENHAAMGWDAHEFGNAEVDFGATIANSPIGTDAAEMIIGADGDGVNILEHADFACTRLGDLGEISYWTFVESHHANLASGLESAPYLFLNIDVNRNGSVDEVIVYEPTFNGNVLQNTWQQWQADEGRWHLAGSPEMFTLAEYMARHPDATLMLLDAASRPDIYTNLSVVPNWENFRGALEGYTLTTRTPSVDVARTYEFEDVGTESALID